MQPAVADVNRVIAIFRKYNFASFSPSPQLGTAVAWQSFMREFSFGQEFQHHDIGPQLQLDYPVIVSIRANLWDSLTAMISDSTAPFTLYPRIEKDANTGERTYNEFWTGNRWHAMQVQS